MSGNRLGDYEILEPLGEGGMGAVFRARHARLGRVIALKVLKSGTVVNEEHERRFQREMTLAAGLSHPHLVKILDGGTVDGTAFIAMELVDGLTVTHMVSNWSPLPWHVAVAIASRIADGLAYLHDRSILHRDVKPSNVLVSYDGFVKLLDFGLARGHNATVMTQVGAVVGTLQYLSPELLTGAEATPATDLWATGVVLYVMLCGRMHVTAAEFNDWVQAIVNDPITPPGAIVPTLPAQVSQLVMRALAREPKQRPPTAAALRDELDVLLEKHAHAGWDRVLTPGLLQALDAGSFQPPAPPAQQTAQLDPVAPGPAGLASITGQSRKSGRQQRPPLRSGAPVPTNPPAKRRRAVALALPICALGIALAVALVRPPPRPQPAPSASEPSADDDGAARPLDPSIRSGYARRLFKYRTLLRLGNATGKRTAEELRRGSPVDVGTAPENWLYWIELEQWIAHGARGSPPRYIGRQSGEMDWLSERLSLGFLNQVGTELTASLIASVIKAAGAQPDDGRTWLSLGRVYEMEGRIDDARLVYARALPRLEGIDLEPASELIWAGLIGALQLVPGRALEHDWYVYLPRGNSPRAWSVLKTLLKADPARFDAVLKAGLTDPRHAGLRSLVLNQMQVERGTDPAYVRRLWNEALDADPAQAPWLTGWMLVFLAERGRIEDARALVKRSGQATWTPILDYLGGDAERASLDWRAQAGGTRVLYLRLEAFRQLELRQVADAEALAEALKADPLETPRELAPLLAELIGQGTTRAWVEPKLLELIGADPPDMGLWNDATGALSSPAGQGVMPRWLGRPGGQQPIAGWREVERALWSSRRGKHALALDALQTAIDAYGDDWMPGTEVCEVLARPLLDQLAGGAPDATAVARARPMLPPSLKRGTWITYLDHLRAGRMDQARDVARNQFELTPHQFFWPLAWALHSRYGGDPEQAAKARARLTACVRWHGCGLWALEAAAR